MRYQQITPSLFIKNRKKLVDKLPPNAIAFINANDEMPRNGDQNFPFRQNSDLFYLTGIEQEKTILALCPGHPDPGKREILFINKPESQTELWDGEQLTSEESKNISGIKNIRWLYEFYYYIGQIINKEAVFY